MGPGDTELMTESTGLGAGEQVLCAMTGPPPCAIQAILCPSLGLSRVNATSYYDFTREISFIHMQLELKDLKPIIKKPKVLTSLGSPCKSRGKDFCEDKGRGCG